MNKSQLIDKIAASADIPKKRPPDILWMQSLVQLPDRYSKDIGILITFPASHISKHSVRRAG